MCLDHLNREKKVYNVIMDKIKSHEIPLHTTTYRTFDMDTFIFRLSAQCFDQY